MMGTLRHRVCIMIISTLILASCQTTGNKDTIAKLHSMRIEIKEEKIDGGLEKAMEGYRRFLENTPDSSPLKPEAIRRLADLKIEREYGSISPVSGQTRKSKDMTAPERSVVVSQLTASVINRNAGESQADFEKRATKNDTVASIASSEASTLPGAENLERTGAREALVLYQKLLAEYPNYQRNDQVLYQMSRAYEELGQVDDAMKVMNNLVKAYPNSRYIDEVQFRRGEYYFTRKHYMDAEEAYQSVVHLGSKSYYYQLALYKLGWTFYKQEMYEQALDRYIALLDYKVSVGYDFSQTKDEQ
jgi:tetratricopeptide (TPR) repeat protein